MIDMMNERPDLVDDLHAYDYDAATCLYELAYTERGENGPWKRLYRDFSWSVYGVDDVDAMVSALTGGPYLKPVDGLTAVETTCLYALYARSRVAAYLKDTDEAPTNMGDCRMFFVRACSTCCKTEKFCREFCRARWLQYEDFVKW